MERTHPSRGETRVVWLTLVILLAAIYLYFPNQRAVFFTANELSRIYLTQAIVEQGSFRIDRAVERYGGAVDLARFEGHYYSDKAPGVSFLSVPVYFLFRTLSGGTSTERDLVPVCRDFVVTLPALLFLALVFRRWSGYGALGRVLVVGLAVGTSFFPFAISYYGHVLLAVLLFWIYGRVTEVPPEETRPRQLAWTGFLCALAVLVDFTGGVFVVLVGLYVLWRTRSPVPFVWLAAGAAPILAVLFTYNYQCFGSPFDLAYNHMLLERDQAHRTTGFFGIGLPAPEAILGLTLGLGRGLFVYSPFLLLLFPAVKTLGRPWRWEARDVLAGATIVAYLWLNASLIDWQGGWTLGPRYLVPIYPFALSLILRASSVQGDAARRRGLTFAVAAVTWSGLFHLAGVGSWLHTPAEPLRFPVPEIASYLFAHGLAWENVGLGLGLRGPWSLAPAVVLFAAAMMIGLREESRGWLGLTRSRHSLAAALGALFLVVVFSLAHRTMGEEQIEKARLFATALARAPALDPR